MDLVVKRMLVVEDKLHLSETQSSSWSGTNGASQPDAVRITAADLVVQLDRLVNCADSRYYEPGTKSRAKPFTVTHHIEMQKSIKYVEEAASKREYVFFSISCISVILRDG